MIGSFQSRHHRLISGVIFTGWVMCSSWASCREKRKILWFHWHHCFDLSRQCHLFLLPWEGMAFKRDFVTLLPHKTALVFPGIRWRLLCAVLKILQNLKLCSDVFLPVFLNIFPHWYAYLLIIFSFNFTHVAIWQRLVSYIWPMEIVEWAEFSCNHLPYSCSHRPLDLRIKCTI